MSSHLPPFQRLIDAHREDVWRLLVASVGRTDAEDCFQETFVSALRAYPKLRPSANLRAWLLTIAHRKALDVHRARGRGALPVAEIADTVDVARVAGEPYPNRDIAPGAARRGSPVAVDRDENLWQAVNELPERQRSAVVLRFVGDLAHRDIATAIGCSEEAARRSLHEGLSRLRKEVAS
jgi:RNA polymerase sigma factor (sigma-70 family)